MTKNLLDIEKKDSDTNTNKLKHENEIGDIKVKEKIDNHLKRIRDRYPKDDSISHQEHLRRYEENMAKLRFWIWECQQWKQYHSTYFERNPHRRVTSFTSTNNTNSFNINFTFNNGNNNYLQNTTIIPGDPNDGNRYLYRIPPLWKRIVADGIDFIVVLFMKITFLWVFLNGFFDYDENSFFRHFRELYADIQNEGFFEGLFEGFLTYEQESEMIAIAIFHRLIVIIYETTCLWWRFPNYPYGGATLGKMCMGLAVLSIHNAEPSGNRTVRIFPGRSIGFLNSLVRAVIKNSSLIFFIPSCITLVAFPFNRMVYDIICRSIVLEVIG